MAAAPPHPESALKPQLPRGLAAPASRSTSCEYLPHQTSNCVDHPTSLHKAPPCPSPNTPAHSPSIRFLSVSVGAATSQVASWLADDVPPAQVPTIDPVSLDSPTSTPLLHHCSVDGALVHTLAA